MRALMSGFRWASKPSFAMLFAGIFMLGAMPARASSEALETIQATYLNGDNVVSVSLTIDNYSTPSGLQTLSQAFAAGQDQGLAIALSKTIAAGRCSITGVGSFDVAFIQMVVTPTGRKITFITNRPLQFGESTPDSASRSFDLAVGEFDINDRDNSKSTGYLYPASKLAIDPQGEFHYNLAGAPWTLINVLDWKGTPASVQMDNAQAVKP